MILEAATANGLRIPSTAEELAAETRNAARRRCSSRSQGLCLSSDFATGWSQEVNWNDPFPREVSPRGECLGSIVKL